MVFAKRLSSTVEFSSQDSHEGKLNVLYRPEFIGTASGIWNGVYNGKETKRKQHQWESSLQVGLHFGGLIFQIDVLQLLT